ncbi:hypothetical protein AAMO2058_000752800 [Amorphochlora amoebiformis]
MVSKSYFLLAGYVLMCAFGAGFIICCWLSTTATSSVRDGFMMVWNSVMMLCTLAQMLFWRIFHGGSNLLVGVSLSMMVFMSLQAVLAAATYVNTNNDHAYDEAVASFGIMYAFVTICHVGLMALWRHGEPAYETEVDKKDYAPVADSVPVSST